jgi:hypothetical protein
MCFKTKKKKDKNSTFFKSRSFIQIIHISNTNWAFFGMSGPV